MHNDQTVKPMNLLFIMSDEHNKAMMGCHNHPVVKTPHLDSLASKGVRFTNAYSTCPICVPARASLATGKYVHQTGYWDNAAPYDGQVPSWGHLLMEQGYEVRSIGKLHYRSDEDNNGFTESRIPLHVANGIGDIYSLVRDDMDVRPELRKEIIAAGPGESSYIRYDRAIAEEAIHFLKNESQQIKQPWVLFVSFVTPHYPFIVPEEYYNMYPPEDVLLPHNYALEDRSQHPYLKEMRRHFDLEALLDEADIRKTVAAYYGLCSFMDAQVGKLLNTLEETGLDKNTRIIYTSDHGDTLGEHGMWYKCTMYEGSVGIPFIIAGPDIPQSKVVETPVSLIDCFPTIVEAVGGQLDEFKQSLPGCSLFSIIQKENNLQRVVFSEYHAAGSITAAFMIRKGKYKYIEYVGYEPQLFDLAADPAEKTNLSADKAYTKILEECARELRNICDPEAVHQKVKADQAERLARFGGREKAALPPPDPKLGYSPPPDIFK
jgi:choline-sulfatase